MRPGEVRPIRSKVFAAFNRRWSPMEGTWNVRRTPRNARRGSALVRLPDGSSAPCLLHDRSATGASVLFAGALPAEFRLELPGERARRVALRWRCGSRVGLMFLPDQS